MSAKINTDNLIPYDFRDREPQLPSYCNGDFSKIKECDLVELVEGIICEVVFGGEWDVEQCAVARCQRVVMTAINLNDFEDIRCNYTRLTDFIRETTIIMLAPPEIYLTIKQTIYGDI